MTEKQLDLIDRHVNTHDDWEMRFDVTHLGQFPPEEDSRSTSGIQLDNTLVFEEFAQLMNGLLHTPSAEISRIVGSLFVHTDEVC